MEKPRGPWAATVTPLCDGKIDHEKLVAHIKWLLASGCNGVVLFGSTGEATSFTASERQRALERVLEGGICGHLVIVGTGCCATADSVELSKHAVGLGAAGVLVVPPFFYEPVEIQGLHDVYSKLIEGVASSCLRIYLYHFPNLSGVAISGELLQRLAGDYPDQIAGLKDSTGNLKDTLRFVTDFPELDIFTGDDDLLWPVVKGGGAGSVTATANIIPNLLGEIWRSLLDGAEEAPAAHQLASDVWTLILNNYPIIEALKECLAEKHRDSSWRAVREPLCQLSESTRSELLAGVESGGLLLKTVG